MPNVNLPARGLGLITGNGTLLPSFGLGLAPAAALRGALHIAIYIGRAMKIGI